MVYIYYGVVNYFLFIFIFFLNKDIISKIIVLIIKEIVEVMIGECMIDFNWVLILNWVGKVMLVNIVNIIKKIIIIFFLYFFYI